MRKYLNGMTRDEVLDRLQSGGKIENGLGGSIEYVKGVLCATTPNGYEIINYQLNLIDGINWYFELPLKTIDVKVGQLYRTREGEKAYVFNRNKEGDFSVAIEGGIVYNVLPTGYYTEEKESDEDLVSYWEDNTDAIAEEVEKRLEESEKKSEEDLKRKKFEQDVIDAYTKGWTMKEISIKYGCSQSKICKLLATKSVKSPRLELQKDEVKKLCEEGKNYGEIAAAVGKSYGYIAKLVSTTPELHSVYQHKRG